MTQSMTLRTTFLRRDACFENTNERNYELIILRMVIYLKYSLFWNVTKCRLVEWTA
jgi:hypothetical protein